MTNNYKNLINKLSIVPKKPGCYLWKNNDGNVIYVGKAKNLYNRMHQYFDSPKDQKTTQLVQNISDFDYFIVSNQNEALILENNLIKKYYPKFNILLKDTSDYPYIVLTDSVNPKLLYTHKYNSIKGKYFGPIADSSLKSYDIYKILLEISPFNKNGLSQFNSNLYNEKNNFEIYEIWKKYLEEIFSGKVNELQNLILKWEKQSCELLNFEQAQKYHNVYEALEKIANSQLVQLNSNKYADYIAYYVRENFISINIFSYIGGKLLNKHSYIHEIFDNDIDSLISNYLVQYYSINKVPKKIIISMPNDINKELSDIFNSNFSSPNSDIDRQYIEMSLNNAKDNYERNIKSIKLKSNLVSASYQQLKEILNLDNLYRIDIFDISNINNTDPIGGVIVYINGKPIKKMYRKYILNNDDGIGDFYYMKQVIFKRYSHALKYNEELPNLIIVDGGSIQLKAANEILQSLNINKIKLMGLKKDIHHKTESIVTNDFEYKLDKNSQLYLMLLNMQEEVHSWAISNFRNLNIKNKFVSFFQDIKGMGKARINKLLSKYPTLKDIYYASNNELEQIIPPKLITDIKEKIKNEIKL